MQPINFKKVHKTKNSEEGRWKKTCSWKCKELLTGRQGIINAFESRLFLMKNMDITDDHGYFIYDDEFYTTNPSLVLGPWTGR